MADQAQRGERREGREGKEAVPQSQKCFGGQRSGKHLLWPGGTLRRWERPVAVVCAAQLFSMWVDLYLGLG